MGFDLFGLFSKKPTASVKPLQVDTDNTQGLSLDEIGILNQIREAEKTFRDIDRGIDEITGNDYRVMTISDWLAAIRQADQPYTHGYLSSWVELFDIFANMLTDTHVQASIDTLAEGLLSKEFYIADAQGNKLDDATGMFKSKWLYDYLIAILNIRLWGFGLIQLRNFDPATMNLEVAEVNRKHVRPDLGGFTRQQWDQEVWRRWDRAPYRTWTIYQFDAKLGKLNACVRWWIYKTEISRYWAIFNQLYGTPPIMGKTSLKSRERRSNMIESLKNFIRSRFIVMDVDDVVEQMNSTATTNQQFFENFIRLCDEQISKALLGSTMVLDDGSSRSQSEVHADNTAKFVKSVARMAMFSINNELMPRLREIGVPTSILPDDARFMWDYSEKLTMKERAEVVQIMSNNYDISPDIATEFVGIEVQEKEMMDLPLNPQAQDVVENYKKRLKYDGTIEHNN